MTCPPCNQDCAQGRECPARSCVGKFKYPSMQLAEMVTSRKQGAKSVAYKCQFCAYFHVGDSADPKRELRKAK